MSSDFYVEAAVETWAYAYGAAGARSEELAADDCLHGASQGHLEGRDARQQGAVGVVHLHGDGDGGLAAVDEDVVEGDFGLVVAQGADGRLVAHACPRVGRAVGEHVEGAGHVARVVHGDAVVAKSRGARGFAALAVGRGFAPGARTCRLFDESAQVGGDEAVLCHWAVHLHGGAVDGRARGAAVGGAAHDRGLGIADEGFAPGVGAAVAAAVAQDNLLEVGSVVVFVGGGAGVDVVDEDDEAVVALGHGDVDDGVEVGRGRAREGERCVGTAHNLAAAADAVGVDGVARVVGQQGVLGAARARPGYVTGVVDVFSEQRKAAVEDEAQAEGTGVGRRFDLDRRLGLLVDAAARQKQRGQGQERIRAHGGDTSYHVTTPPFFLRSSEYPKVTPTWSTPTKTFDDVCRSTPVVLSMRS